MTMRRGTRVGPAVPALVLLGLGGCTPSEVFGWVWADQPGAASYTPAADHQFNSLGATNTVSRSAVGTYEVTFSGLGGVHGGNVQVTARGADSVRCKAAGWQTTGPDVTASVRCFSGMAAADGEFLASYEAIDHADPQLAYTHYDPPPAPMVTVAPDPTRSWNVTGVYQPTHTVLFTSPVTGFAIEHVTADGTGPELCSFGVLRVTCFDAAGGPTETAFSYVKGLGRLPGSALRGAYAVYDIAPGGIYPPMAPHVQQSSFSSTPITVTRLGVGLYAVLLPGAATPQGNALVHVTALDLGASGAPVMCKLVTWNAAGADVVVQVACFLVAAGAVTPTEDGFHVSYLVP
jgi:hypothetical protein